MSDNDTEEHLTTTEARAGSGVQDNKVALFAGLALVVVLFAVLLFVWR